MKPFHVLVLSVFLPIAAVAAQEGAPGAAAEGMVMEATGVTLAEFLWIKRPVFVFAESPNDPNFIRQMELIRADLLPLAERDVVVITDTDPAAMTAARQRFRPRGFGIVLMDKDGVTTLRKPLPWDVREITRAIDKWPLARQEMLDRFPSGR